MELTRKKVTRRLPELDDVKRILQTAFTKEDLAPFGYLMHLARRRMVEFWAYYDNNKVVGVTYELKSENIQYILYLAVDKQQRSKGYGSKILQIVKDSHPDKVITLSIEPVDPHAKNYKQRVSRYRFYKRNGYINTGYGITYDLIEWVMAKDNDFDHRELIDMVEKFSYGKYPHNFEKIDFSILPTQQ